MSRFEGYHDPATLPFKKGDRVRIKAGVAVRHRGNTKPAGRSYVVTVDHILPGRTDRPFTNEPPKDVENPKVRWAGSGGYWSEADINDVEKAA